MTLLRQMRALVAVALLVACATPAPRSEPSAGETKLASGIDASGFEKTVRAQDDFFRAVNGAWLARTEIPADRSSFGAFAALAEKAEADVRALCEQCASARSTAGSEEQKIGDTFAAFMDEARAEKLGTAPIKPDLDAIEAIAEKSELARRLGELRRVGVSGAFRVHVSIDAKHPDRHVLAIGQDGLGLPDRDYYLKKKYADKLAAYEPHVARVLALAGIADATSRARAIVAFETEIAKAHWPKEESRDDSKTHNEMTREELAALAPSFDWDAFFDAAGVRDVKKVTVAQPSYFAAFSKLVDTTPLETWRAWLERRVVHHFAESLQKELVDAEFDFYASKLRGVPQQRPRWKRAVSAVEGALGEALGKIYVREHYPPEAAKRMAALVANVIAAYRERIEHVEWMSAATREKALAKLAAFTPKIGHTKKWRDYGKLDVARDDAIGNARRAAAFEWNRQVTKLGETVDREEWHMLPQTVNAYYSSSMNEIVFPAAILQPPFFDLAADDAVNYGSIGAVIGHELGHGFDDQGSKWDGSGAMVDWWQPADRAEFDKRASKLAAQYDGFEPLPGFHVNGRLTLGENMGDLAGLTVAFVAYRRSLGGKPAPAIDGWSGDQRFFLGFAQIWRTKRREEELKQHLATDPHSPAEFRANGTVRNVDAFYEAFGVKPGDKMFLPEAERVRIW